MARSIIQTACTALATSNQTFGEQLVLRQVLPIQPVTGLLTVNKYFGIFYYDLKLFTGGLEEDSLL